jgi:Ca2+-transporting ATPase
MKQNGRSRIHTADKRKNGEESTYGQENTKSGENTSFDERSYIRGTNVLEADEEKSVAAAFLEQLNDPLIFILFVAAAISLLLGELGDMAIILAVVFVNAVIGVIQEGKAKRALDALKKLTSPHALLRESDGHISEIPASDLIPGDIVCLEPGRQVPADLKLLSAVNLKIEEAALTGESVSVSKDTAENNRAYMSTNVTCGRGEGVVTAIGMDTEIGRIAHMLKNTKTEPTPLQKRLADLGKILSTVSVFLCVLLFFLAVLQHRNMGEMLLTAISLAVAAVPEGLPAIVTMVLALGVSRMVKVNTIVKRLPSVETLGCVSVVCSDKTGTLTQNRMTVVRCFTEGKILEPGELKKGVSHHFIEGFALCNDGVRAGEERMGDPTELALLDFAALFAVERETLEKNMQRIGEIAFDSERKMMTTLHRSGGKNYISYTKGSPEEVLKRCSHMYSGGEKKPFTETTRKEIDAALTDFASRGLRVLALAMKEEPAKNWYKSQTQEEASRHISENNLTFLGLAGLADPVRPQVKEAVQEFSRAGVKTIMITGDRMDTAFAIAKELGIAEHVEECVSGEELDEMEDAVLAARLPRTSVFAHVSPEHKVRIVAACKKNGEITAMTGDGVNDAPSLKAADVGIAMGMAGTDVAKNAADIVLTDDNFATIAKAIAQGRYIYENIRKSVIFLLSSNFGEIITMLFSVAAGLAAPLKSSHILWINLITDSLPALALGIDVEENKSFMDRPPRAKDESLFAGGGWNCTIFYGILIAVISVIAFLQFPIELLLAEGMPVTFAGMKSLMAQSVILNRCQTYAFTVLGMAQLFHAVGMRDVEMSLFRMNHLENKLMLAAFGFGLALQLLVTEIPYFIGLFGTCRLGIFEWIRLLVLASVPLLAHEILVLLSCLQGKQGDAARLGQEVRNAEEEKKRWH